MNALNGNEVEYYYLYFRPTKSSILSNAQGKILLNQPIF